MGSARHAVGGRPVAVGLRGPGGGGLRVEANGINVDRRGRAQGPPARAVLAVVRRQRLRARASATARSRSASGISFWQASIVGVVGIVVSFLLCGFVALAASAARRRRWCSAARPSACAATGCRRVALLAADGRLGDRARRRSRRWPPPPCSTALGWGGGDGPRRSSRSRGRRADHRRRRHRLRPDHAAAELVITVVTGVLTVVYIVLVARPDRLGAVVGAAGRLGPGVHRRAGLHDDRVRPRLGQRRRRLLALPAAARVAARGVVGWTTFGASLAPVVLLVFGLLLAGSSHGAAPTRSPPTRSARWPTLLPTWFLVPFAIVAVLGLVGGAVLDIYSSGLALLSVGLRVPRYVAALIDGVIMIARHDLRRLLRRRLPRASSRAS